MAHERVRNLIVSFNTRFRFSYARSAYLEMIHHSQILPIFSGCIPVVVAVSESTICKNSDNPARALFFIFTRPAALPGKYTSLAIFVGIPTQTHIENCQNSDMGELCVLGCGVGDEDDLRAHSRLTEAGPTTLPETLQACCTHH